MKDFIENYLGKIIILVAFFILVGVMFCHEPTREQSFNEAMRECTVYSNKNEIDKCREDVLTYYRKLIIDERIREENK